jgi:catechol 2,3-dioxygenase-like lactoylglutathione lyase family enzyme
MKLSPCSVHHIALFVRDLTQAERFYGGVLSLPVIRRWYQGDGITPRSIWFELSRDAFLAVELAPSEAPVSAHASPECGWHLLALAIMPRDRDAFRAHLARHGHPVTHETPYTLYCRDPEGNRVGLSHYPHPADDES